MAVTLILAPRHSKVLNLLQEKSPSRLTSTEIHKLLGGSKQVLYKDLRDLVGAGYIHKKATGVRNTVVYFTKGGTAAVGEIEITPVESPTLLHLMQRFAEETDYFTKVQQYAWVLPYSLAQLYQFATNQLAGQKVTNVQLKEVRDNLIKLRQLSQNFDQTVASLLVSSELWEAGKYQKLLFGDAPIELIQKFVENLVDNWGTPRVS